MTSIIHLQTFSGVGEEPHCYLLQVDEFRFLLDCGWDENFNLDYLKELKKYAGQIDAVLISYPDTLHLGALPYMVGKGGLSCPIYATIPVFKMGQMFLYDLYQSHCDVENFELFNLDDVDTAFDRMTQVKYNQNVSLKGKGYGLTIIPVPSGHMIGGTIWKILKDGEEDIVYAVDFNHKKERHLNGCELEGLGKPSLLITDAFNATYNQMKRKLRDEQLMTNILQTLRSSGNVLMAVDTAGRILELAHMVDQLWSLHDSGLLAYSLALLNNVCYNVVEFAKSQIEWMSEKLMRSFEGRHSNPFHFKHLKLCHSLAELKRVPEPKVVLCSMPDLECGFARDLFMEWCSNKKNSIILTQRTGPGTLARDLIDNPDKSSVTLEVRSCIRLEGLELLEYRRKHAHDKENKEKMETGMESSDESGDEMEFLAPSGKAKHDLILKPDPADNQTGFFKSAKKQHPMFPFREDKVRYDDYGEIIRAEDYKISDVVMEEAEKEQLTVKPEVNGAQLTNNNNIDKLDIPTKYCSRTATFPIHANITYIDFEGRSDGESIEKLIQQMKPRRVIIVRGSEENCAAVSRFASDAGAEKVFIAQKYNIIDATTESYIYQVRLRDSLVSTLSFSKGKDAEVAWLDGLITMHREENKDLLPINEKVDDDIKDQIPILDPLPPEQAPGHNISFINELKLSDFKQVLTRAGITSEFSAGILWCCNGTLALHRLETGRITMEGCLSDDYYLVRQLLYQQYAII